ncbi:MAG TPA: serine/threonine-protein kinase [Polyangiaceae bacterium]
MLRLLGMGTMGEVFLVEHSALGRRFVAKILHARHAGAADYVARLEREARTLGQMRHPNIVTATDFDVTGDGRPFFVMEYLEGHTLSDELKQRGRLPRADALLYVGQILSALTAAHAKGIIHRDIKPQNLFLHVQGGAPSTIKVLDFGAARDTKGFTPLAVPLATSTGAVVGTLAYLSPEGANGQRVDPRADLYAVGLVLSTMLSGHLPPAHRVPGNPFVEADLALPNDAQPIAPLILKALEIDPGRRFQSAEEFLVALPGR